MKSICKQGPAWALLILRLLLGSTFILHGSQKVLGLFDGPGLTGFAAAVSKTGAPAALAYLAAFFEFIGGWLVLLGIAAEIGALMIAPVMLVAIAAVHWKHGYFSQKQGFEYPFNLLLVAIALILGGPGKLALWDAFKRCRTQA